MNALITGGTGLIGRQLVAISPGASVLSRNPTDASRKLGCAAHAWQPEDELPPSAAFGGIDVVFNLAGEPVGEGRWTPEKKRRIRDSRVLGTRNLVAGLAALPTPPRLLISASAVGYYGDRGDDLLDESAASGSDFLAGVCAAWEREAMGATALGMRVVCVRTGIVLAPGGGALARMLTPFKLGVGGRIGSGKQWMSCIHIDDLVGLLLHASSHDGVTGALNAVCPSPVRNLEFTRALAHAVHRPAVIPIPKTALRLALGEMSEVLLGSQRVVPKEAQRSGYTFKYPSVADALRAVMAALSTVSRS